MVTKSLGIMETIQLALGLLQEAIDVYPEGSSESGLPLGIDDAKHVSNKILESMEVLNDYEKRQPVRIIPDEAKALGRT